MRNSNKKSSLSSGILLFLVGSIFSSLGVAILVIVIKGIIKVNIVTIGVGIIMPIILILALLGFGSTALIMGGKTIYSRIKQNRTYNRGKETSARIVDFKSASFRKGGNNRIRFALMLAYNENGENKMFTTDYLFDTNEFRYLKKLDNIKIKIDNNFVVVCEPFPNDIYIVDSTYGIEIEFFKQKPVAILLRLWLVFFIIAVVFLIISFFIKKSDITLTAIIFLFSIHFPFVIPLAIFLIKWIIKKHG